MLMKSKKKRTQDRALVDSIREFEKNRTKMKELIRKISGRIRIKNPQIICEKS